MARFTSFRIAPGVRLSASRRGFRAHVGPRFARVHVGGGRSGVSTGAGPFTWYASGGSGSRQPGRTPSGGLTTARAQKLDAHQVVARQLNELLSLHQQRFAPVAQLQVQEPELPAFRALLEAAEKHELKGVSPFDMAGRRTARSRGRTTAEEWARDLLVRSRSDRATRQAELDAHWTTLVSNAPQVVIPASNARFEASGRPARAVGVLDARVLIALTLPSVDAVPSSKPAVTPHGTPTVHQATKTERAEWYRHYVASQILLAAKEAFASGPGLLGASVVASYGGQPLVAAHLNRAAFDRISWSLFPWDALTALDPMCVFRFRGQSRELQPIDLSTDQEFAFTNPSPSGAHS